MNWSTVSYVKRKKNHKPHAGLANPTLVLYASISSNHNWNVIQWKRSPQVPILDWVLFKHKTPLIWVFSITTFKLIVKSVTVLSSNSDLNLLMPRVWMWTDISLNLTRSLHPIQDATHSEQVLTALVWKLTWECGFGCMVAPHLRSNVHRLVWISWS